MELQDTINNEPLATSLKLPTTNHQPPTTNHKLQKVLTYLKEQLNATEKNCIIITGATASGKTALAIQIAQYFSTQIISADSRQCFKELNIGVAKPTHDELNLVQHHFINSHSINDEVTAATFEKYALEKASNIFATNNICVVAGGTGLYINAFCNGLDAIPTTTIDLRKSILEKYKANGILWLQNELKNNDELFYQKGEMQNPQRMMRALEVVQTTGKSILEYQQKTKVKRPFNIIKIGIEMERELLYNRINQRVDIMIEQGLEAEATQLHTYKNLNALRTVGYSEWFDYFEQKQTKQKTIELIKQNTRHYAKRQLTWFKRDGEVKWFEV